MTGILFELSAIATSAYLYGWRGAVFALACVAAGHVAGHSLMLAALKRAGYVVEYARDGRGQHGARRWRVGVRDVAAVEPPVMWIAPGDGVIKTPVCGPGIVTH